MTTIDSLKKEIEWVDKWTFGLISDLDENNWGIIDNLGTSINWQVGHILISKHFHSIQSILPKDHELLAQINQELPITDLMSHYFAGSKPNSEWPERPNKTQILDFKKKIDQASMRILDGLTEIDLDQKTEISNPIARSKYDALSFTYKHQMWHNGQIAMIKRIVA